MVVAAPSIVWSAKALEIRAEHEQEATMCLELVKHSGSELSYDEAAAVQLFGERLSQQPHKSEPSRIGYKKALGLLSDPNQSTAVSQLLASCRARLATAIETYTWHSCGFGTRTISERWSLEERQKFRSLIGWRVDVDMLGPTGNN